MKLIGCTGLDVWLFSPSFLRISPIHLATHSVPAIVYPICSFAFGILRPHAYSAPSHQRYAWFPYDPFLKVLSFKSKHVLIADY